jgi:hypothetical protein
LIAIALDEPAQAGCVARVPKNAERVDPLGRHEQRAKIQEGTVQSATILDGRRSSGSSRTKASGASVASIELPSSM